MEKALNAVLVCIPKEIQINYIFPYLRENFPNQLKKDIENPSTSILSRQIRIAMKNAMECSDSVIASDRIQNDENVNCSVFQNIINIDINQRSILIPNLAHYILSIEIPENEKCGQVETVFEYGELELTGLQLKPGCKEYPIEKRYPFPMCHDDFKDLFLTFVSRNKPRKIIINYATIKEKLYCKVKNCSEIIVLKNNLYLHTNVWITGIYQKKIFNFIRKPIFKYLPMKKS